MKPMTPEWIAKAEGDFVVVERECRARRSPNYDAACFHAQQCAEKYLKARMLEGGQEVIRIHNLPILLDRVVLLEPAWELFRPDLMVLTRYAVSFRYPGDLATKEQAFEARNCCRRFRRAAREALGLDAE